MHADTAGEYGNNVENLRPEMLSFCRGDLWVVLDDSGEGSHTHAPHPAYTDEQRFFSVFLIRSAPHKASYKSLYRRASQTLHVCDWVGHAMRAVPTNPPHGLARRPR